MKTIEMIKNYKNQIMLPAISGGSIKALYRTYILGKIERKYYGQAILAAIFSVLAEPFRIIERLWCNKKINNVTLDKDPVFIVGHWRSGTTHLHNIICQDPQMAYVTTLQGSFPEVMLAEPGKTIFRTFVNVFLPKKRQGDNVQMHPDFPQEEEFALGNKHAFSFYNFWYFPNNTRSIYQRNIEFKNVDTAKIDMWQQEYLYLAKKAILNTKGSRFISKNPPNTGRIKEILKVFPNAKFIHIYRNPVAVYLSTKKFFDSMMPSLQLQDISDADKIDNIIWVYKKIMQQYFEDMQAIPKGNLVEVKFEDLEILKVDEIERIYNTLNIDGFKKALPNFIAYFEKKKSYKKNTHVIDAEILNRILKEWDFSINKWNYNVPKNVEIINKRPSTVLTK